MMNRLHRLVLEYVRHQPGPDVDGEIRIDGFEEQDVLEATRWLVDNRYLAGSFPLNPNFRQGYEWGYVSVPRP